MFRINNKIYKTKKEITDLIKNILHNYKVGESINDNDKQVVSDLLKYHPNADEKIGCGILGFKIRQHSVYKKQRGFELIRTDNSPTDFSYIKCITHPSLLNIIKECCRDAIKDDILKFKNNAFDKKQTIICPITNEVLTQSNCHIHHCDPQFIEIFNGWYKDKTITVADINESLDNVDTTFFTNEDLKNSFRTFHNKICKLRAVSVKANLSLLK